MEPITILRVIGIVVMVLAFVAITIIGVGIPIMLIEESKRCKTCKGLEKVQDKNEKWLTCPECGGDKK